MVWENEPSPFQKEPVEAENRPLCYVLELPPRIHGDTVARLRPMTY